MITYSFADYIRLTAITYQSFGLNKKRQPIRLSFFGGEEETRTPAPVTRPTPLAGAPRHQLEYFSIGAVKKRLLNKNGGESGIRTHGTQDVRRFSRPFRYDHFGISPYLPKYIIILRQRCQVLFQKIFMHFKIMVSDSSSTLVS